MTTLEDIKKYFDDLILKIEGIDGLLFFVDEKQIAKKLLSKTGRQLAITYPSISGSGNNDNRKQHHEMLLFVLFKGSGQTMSDNEEFEEFSACLSIIDKIRNEICENFSESHYLWRGLNISETETDPIFNLSGWSGWSLLVVF